MAIGAPRDCDRSIPGWRSFRPRMAIDASQDCDRASRNGYHYNPGWRSMPPGIVIDARVAIETPRDGVAASKDGDRFIPGMAIDASRDGDHCIP